MLDTYRVVVTPAGEIALVGIGRRGDFYNSCQNEGTTEEFLVVRLDESGKRVGLQEIPEDRIDGCADFVARAALDQQGRLLFSGSFTEWPPRFSLPDDGGPKTAMLFARLGSEADPELQFDPTPEEQPLPVAEWERAIAPASDGGLFLLHENDPFEGGARLERTGRDQRVVRGFGGPVAGVPPKSSLELERVWELAVDPKRGIYGFGGFYPTEESGDEIDVVFRHWLRDGKPDSTFGEEGSVNPHPSSGHREFPGAHDFALQADGKPIVAGVVYRGPRTRVFVARFTSEGEPDPTFGNAGFAEFDLGSADNDLRHWASLALGREGRLLVAGTILGRGTTVFGLRADGRLDERFGEQGRLELPRL